MCWTKLSCLLEVEVQKSSRTIVWASRRVSVAASDAHFNHLVTLALAKARMVQYWFNLRGIDRESYERGRAVFGNVIVGAAERLRKSK